jgi:hypothetical protein
VDSSACREGLQGSSAVPFLHWLMGSAKALSDKGSVGTGSSGGGYDGRA